MNVKILHFQIPHGKYSKDSFILINGFNALKDPYWSRIVQSQQPTILAIPLNFWLDVR
jgi:hypothetical protein